ncbi:MAG: hypothetical protein WC939_00860 [Acholeplasmataceae bacterium]
MNKLTTLFVLMVLLLTACGGKGQKTTVEVLEGEIKTVDVAYNLEFVVYEVSEVGIAYPSVVDEKFLIKGIKEGNVLVTVFKDNTKKDKLEIEVKVIKNQQSTGDQYNLTFQVTAPSEVSEVYLSGSFNGWKVNDPLWKLTKDGTVFKLDKTIDVIPPVSLYLTLEYKYIADGFWEVSENRKTETIIAGESKTFTDTITAISDVKAEAPNTELRDYTVNTTFNVTAPSDATTVHVTGAFNGWKVDDAYKLEKVGPIFTLTKDFEVLNTTSNTYDLEYKYIVNGYWEEMEGNRHAELKEQEAKTITDTVSGIGNTPASGDTFPTETYTLNLTLTTPIVPNDVDIYLLGNVNDWGNGENVSEWKLTKVSNTEYTLNITFETGVDTLEFKFSNLYWAHVEKRADGSELPNRTLSLTKEPMTISLSVARWNE